MKPLSPQQAAELEALEARFALRVGAALSRSSTELGSDISERLRFAREQAVRRRRQLSEQTASTIDSRGGAAALGGGSRPRRLLWLLASALPWVLLFAGLFYIHDTHMERQLREVADIDAALLADDLPPAAYTDPGFAAFLKAAAR